MSDAIEWNDFARTVAELAEVDPALVTPEASLVRGLRLDSLSLTSLVVGLLERYDAPALSGRLDGREWEATTVGQLFNECRGPSRASVAGDRNGAPA